MNHPYNRTVIHPLEKPLADDINQAESDLDRAIRFLGKHLIGGVNAFLGSGLKVVAQSPTAMAVNVSVGLGFQDNPADVPVGIDAGAGPVIGLNDLESYKPLPLLTIQTFAVPAAPAGPNTRIDIIEVRADRLITDPTSRQVLDTGTGAFNPATLNKTLQWALDTRTGIVISPAPSTAPLSYKTGVAANPGVAPATTAGYIKLAEIFIGSAVVSIPDAVITDSRLSLGPLRPILDVELLLPVSAGQPGNVAPFVVWGTAIQGRWELQSVQEVVYPVSIPVGSTILGWITHGQVNFAGDTFRGLLRSHDVDGVTTTIGPLVTSGNTIGTHEISHTLITPHVVTTNNPVQFVFSTPAGLGGVIYGRAVTVVYAPLPVW